MDAAVQRLVAENAIRNQIARLAHVTDTGDMDAYVRIFSQDAVWEIAGHDSRKGHDDILAGARERTEQGLNGPEAHTRHVVSTTFVSVEGDFGTARSVFQLVRNTDKKPFIGFIGSYDDEFRKIGDEWLLARRVVSLG